MIGVKEGQEVVGLWFGPAPRPFGLVLKAALPLLHKDLLDRLRVARTENEPMRLSTSDALLASHGDAVESI